MKPHTKEILQLFRKYGSMNYGERCTVLSHSIQAAMIAKEKGYDDLMVLAAALHDIGHLSPINMEVSYDEMGDFGIDQHDEWGARYLRDRGFPELVIAGVRNHVQAKRYLCSVDPKYYEELSEASKKTMEYQGE